MSISSVDLNVVMFRDRRRNLRRVAEISEVVDSDGSVRPHNLYSWNSQDDTFSKVNESKEIKQKLKRFTGLSAEDIEQDLEEKKTVLKWMVDNDVNDINKVGRVIAEYYSRDESKMLEKIKNGAEFDTLTSTR
jgi:flagellar protein FlaI